MFGGIQDERINGAVMRNDRIDRNFNCGIRDKSITTGAEFALFDVTDVTRRTETLSQRDTNVSLQMPRRGSDSS